MKSTNSIKAKKSLGQNFLKDENIIKKIVEISKADKNTDIIEIGPGLGAVTKYLVEAGKSLTAIEIDDRLYENLENKFGHYENFRLIKQDVLKTDISSLTTDNTIIVANLPYYITTPIITTLLENKYNLKSLTIMIQLEVAKRICADEKSKDYGALSVLCNYYCDTSLELIVDKTCFEPVPKVTSGVVKMDFCEKPKVTPKDEKEFFRVVKSAFSNRRKTLANCLMNSYGYDRETVNLLLEKSGVDIMARGETLSLENFKNLSDEITILKENKN